MEPKKPTHELVIEMLELASKQLGDYDRMITDLHEKNPQELVKNETEYMMQAGILKGYISAMGQVSFSMIVPEDAIHGIIERLKKIVNDNPSLDTFNDLIEDLRSRVEKNEESKED